MNIFSIITPIYNGEKYINDCYKSILLQTLNSWEWIVVDDGSTDNTKNVMSKIANSDTRVKFYSLESNRGRGYARNLCINKTSNKWIVIWDIDDLSSSNRLEELAKYINKDYDYIYSTCVLISRSYEIYGLRKKIYSKYLNLQIPIHPSICIKKDLFTYYNYSIYGTKGGIGEDYSVQHTLGKYYKGYYIDKPLVYFFEDTEVNVVKAYDSNKAYLLDLLKYKLLFKDTVSSSLYLIIKLIFLRLLRMIPKRDKIYYYTLKNRQRDSINGSDKEAVILHLQKILTSE